VCLSLGRLKGNSGTEARATSAIANNGRVHEMFTATTVGVMGFLTVVAVYFVCIRKPSSNKGA